MGKLTRETLQKLRKEKKAIEKKEIIDDEKVYVIVGMGSCGIAAGAKKTWQALEEEISSKGLTDTIKIKQTSCMGNCHSEPIVEVRMKDMPSIIYGNVDEAIAVKIIQKHVMARKLLNNHIQDRPV